MSDTTANTPELHEDTLPPQAKLMHFTIIKVLGQGGFGITYLVRDEHLECDCVLKENMPRMFSKRNSSTMLVSSLVGEDMENGYLWSLQRFKEEAKTLAKLNHPNIIRVKDLFDALGTSYYVMEFIDGQELHHATEAHRDEATLQHLLRRLLNALQYLHGKDILHRDIKPSNILVTKQGEPVLIDFGTARSLISEHTHTQLKSQGYTPFEQIQTKGKVGPWTDLYALGATFCHVLTGQCPPDSTDRILEDEFEPLSERADLKAAYSRSFLSSIDKALQPLAKNRWQNVEEWLAALDAEAPAASPLQSRPVQKPKQNTKDAARRELEKRGISDINSKDSEGSTPLHQAVKDSDTETAQLLINAGADIQVKNNDGWTPLHHACRYGTAEMVQLLVNAGADIQVKGKWGWTPLHLACGNGTAEMVQLLVNAGADIQVKDKWGWTPLHNACCSGTAEMVQLLVNAGADIQVKDNAGNTPLHRACRKGTAEMVQLLVNAGADIQAKNNDGCTPLHLACESGTAEMVQLLVNAGADIQVKDNDGCTPLHHACRYGTAEMVQLLVNAGADIQVKDNDGCTPLHHACRYGTAEMVQLLVNAGADIQVKFDDGWTPLLLACRNGTAEMVQLLVNAGADIQVKKNDGWTPLLLACSDGTAEMVQLLVNAGADIQVKKNDGWTPLHYACLDGTAEMVQLLVNAGADIYAKNNDGKTPQEIALSKGNKDVAKILGKAKSFSSYIKHLFS